MSEVDFFEPEEALPEGAGVKEKVTRYVHQWTQLNSEVSDLEEKLTGLKQKVKDLEMKAIPDAMLEAGMKELITLEGLRVKLEQFTGAIPAESKPTAYAWMDANGHSSIIKRTVSVNFDKGSTEAAKKAEEAIRALGLEPKTGLDVHFQTFKAFVREQTAKGVQIPLDSWGVFYGTKAVIKQ